MAAGSMGHQSRISMGASGTAIGSFSEAHEFLGETVQKNLTILNTAGIRGTRSHPAERTRDGTYTVGGTIRYHATPSLLDLLLPRILGAAASGTTFALAETLPTFDLLIDRIAKRMVYATCYVNKATFRARASGLLELDLDVIGTTETTSATAFPAITAPTDAPYVMQDMVGTMSSATRIITEWELVVDNALEARFSNSQTTTDIHATDRIITCTLTTPYTSVEADLHDQNTGSAAAATFVFTNGGLSVTFAIAKLQLPAFSPTVDGKGEITLKSQGICKKSSSTNELIVTNDSTP